MFGKPFGGRGHPCWRNWYLSGNPARPAHDPSDYGHETDTQRDQNQHEYKQADQHHFEQTLFPVNATQQLHQRGTPEVPSPPMCTQQARTASLAFYPPETGRACSVFFIFYRVTHTNGAALLRTRITA